MKQKIICNVEVEKILFSQPLPPFIFKHSMRIITLLLSIIFLPSCVETVVVGSLVGGTLAAREKSLEDTRSDMVITAKLGTDFITNGLKNPGNSIGITVNEGRVLLTGIVRNPEKARLAQDLSWKIKGVKEVIDEIQIKENEKFRLRDFSSAFSDYVITAKVAAQLFFTRDISSINYQVNTVDGVVYLFGVADTEFEMRRVLSVVSKTRGVDEVVNHVILKNDSRRHG